MEKALRPYYKGEINMKIKTIRILEEIIDLELDSLDVLVECENGYTYVVVVTTSAYLAGRMDKKNYATASSPLDQISKL